MKKQEIIDLLQEIDNKQQLEIAIEILDNVSNCLYIDGFVSESNKLVTSLLKIEEVLRDE